MKTMKLLNKMDQLEERKINADVWAKLHRSRSDKYISEYDKIFLKRNNLPFTIFNLNCMDLLSGVILTDMQVEKWKKNLKEEKR